MAETFDLIVRGGRVVTADGIQRSDLGIVDGRIAKVGDARSDSAAVEIEASGRHVFPGIIDAHVHFNEPGRTEWEGLASGSTALAAGGGTCFFDMPLNSEPPVLDAAQFHAKRALAEAKSRLDFGLWGGLTPLNLDQLPALREAGAIGLKAFMSNSGIESFPRVATATLREGMKRAASLGLLVAVHAEDEALAAHFTAVQQAAGRHDAAAWLASRPVEVELAAIRLATELAGETGCALHVVHVSSPEGVACINAARGRGVDVTAETCPHYLLLNDRDVAAIGAAAKCAPPIRDEARRQGLWAAVRRQQIDTIGSDHSPAPEELKQSPDFFHLWGGIAGCQHGFPLLLAETETGRETDWPILAAALAQSVARRFGLRHKGRLAVGYDADFALIETGPPRAISTDELFTRHRLTPYRGRPLRVHVTDTCVRGVPVIRDGRPTRRAGAGRLVRPDR